MNIDTHGFVLRGLAEASRRTVNWQLDYHCVGRTQIVYDPAAQRVLTIELTGKSWTMLDGNLVHVCETSVHMTQQEIADAVAEAMTAGTKYDGSDGKIKFYGLEECCATIPTWSDGNDGKAIGQTLICYDPDNDRVFLQHLMGYCYDAESIEYSCIVVAGEATPGMTAEEMREKICWAISYRRAVGWPYV